MKIAVLSILLLGFTFVVSAQQTPISSQYMMNRLVINPAYAGELGFYSASVSYRKQWVGLDGAPSTQNISIHGPSLKGKLGFGLMFIRDVIGVSKENNISGSFSYKIKFKKKKTLSLGISGSLFFTNNQWSQIITTNKNDVIFSTNSPQFILPDFSVGVYYSAPKYYLAASAPMFLEHTLKSESSGYNIKNNFNNYNYLIEAGLKLKLNKDILIKPSFLSRYIPNSSFQLDLNTTVDYKNSIGIGISYRTQDAIVGLFQIHASQQLIIGYSYDHSISKLQNYNNGSHELFLRYDLKYKVNSLDPRFF